jgi:hypothetical protein
VSERIKQLMDQAGIDVEAVENLGEMPTAIKFAELIVKEFSKQVQIEGRFGLEREQTLIRLCCENAKKHFGVEE